MTHLFAHDPDFMEDFDKSKEVADKLLKKYPGHAWGVQVSNRTGVVDIQLMSSELPHGFRLKLTDIHSDPSLHQVMRAGGELLERAGMTRGAFRDDEFHNAKRDSLGNILVDRG